MKSENQNIPHINGKYAIIVAIIGAITTIGSILLKDYLERKNDLNSTQEIKGLQPILSTQEKKIGEKKIETQLLH